ncbi:hypothetical protein EST38_g5042 [Candolleomyces aberdarensis]|uniref:Uncharacterized protein n=1 Tax=Candolleomyces aberdarensis TaxID=2316362 RepID=A0A4Q2DNT2_9AGAR|nr:hypothetical protein EST38_g5042 [Candolleomyces aberdarensis]
MSNRVKVVEKRGAGLSIRWQPLQGQAAYRGTPFPNAPGNQADDTTYTLPLTTLREFTMLRFMDSVTDKPEWTRKVFERAIVDKWMGEVVTPGESPETEFTLKMFEYCIKELQDLVPRYLESPNGAMKVYNGDVYKSDVAVPQQTKLALQQTPIPLIYGRTKVLPAGSEVTNLEDCVKRCGEGEVVHLPKPRSPNLVVPDDTSGGYSRTFQWLPCEVDISGNKPKITTCINNLHPQKHSELYGLIEDVIEAALPLWDLTLAPLCESSFRFAQRIVYDECLYDPDPESLPDSEQIQPLEGESEDDFLERKWQWFETTRVVVLPEPLEVYKRLEEPKPLSLKDTFGSRPLQIIVKLANIHLTPEKPEYEGGTWHVEGTMNEAICATALYYYSCENTTPSELSFRQVSDESNARQMGYLQDHHDWLAPVFGLEQYGAPFQFVGSVETREGRLITFPNILLTKFNHFNSPIPRNLAIESSWHFSW